ncbi:DUF3857 domain-containing protein, partial [bacterium]|nr:DUF3857 domain-containing protein [bacterium]
MVLQRLLGSLLTVALLLSFAPAVSAQAELPPGDEPPKTLADRIADAGTKDDYKGFNTVIVYDHAINRMKKSGVTYVEKTMLYKVLTPAGVLEKQVLRWDYDPQSSWVDVQKVVIHRDGETIDVPVDDVWDLPAPQRAIYWGNRIKLLQLPKLQVNDGIEVHTLRKGYNYALLGQGEGGASGGMNADGSPPDEKFIPPMPGEYFDIVLFRADVPTIEKKYVLHIVKDKRLISQSYNGPVYTRTDYNADSTIYSWWAVDQPAIAHEPRQPDASDFTPKVVMVTAESWEAKSKWFWDVNQNQFEPTQAIKDKVDAILSELPKNASEEEKAKALVHWVAQNIRYSGQTMGEGEGFTLHPGDMIFENRSGVCKDIAGMLITMMRAAGMQSYPAMTMAGSRIEYEVHADQFNHCVTALKTEDGSWRMYDPTWVPFNNDIWSKLETEQEYLIGHPDGADLREIPYSPPEESQLKIRHNAELSEDGTLTGSFRLDGKGALDSRMRRL